MSVLWSGLHADTDVVVNGFDIEPRRNVHNNKECAIGTYQ